MKNIQKALFYFSSFMPLYLLLVIQNLNIRNDQGKVSISAIVSNFYPIQETSNYFWIGLLVMVIISLLGSLMFFGVYSKKEGIPFKIEEAEFIREDTMGYIVTYIVPLTSININSLRSVVVNLFLFLIIGTFYVKNDQVFMNPLYNLFGYNVFSTENGIYITKISKHKLKIIAKRSIEISKTSIVGDVYLLKEVSEI